MFSLTAERMARPSYISLNGLGQPLMIPMSRDMAAATQRMIKHVSSKASRQSSTKVFTAGSGNVLVPNLCEKSFIDDVDNEKHRRKRSVFERDLLISTRLVRRSHDSVFFARIERLGEGVRSTHCRESILAILELNIEIVELG